MFRQSFALLALLAVTVSAQGTEDAAPADVMTTMTEDGAAADGETTPMDGEHAMEGEDHMSEEEKTLAMFLDLIEVFCKEDEEVQEEDQEGRRLDGHEEGEEEGKSTAVA